MSVPVEYRPYFVGALELPGELFAEVLPGYGPDHPIWDFKPYADRFTLKEALAHVEDWNDVFRGRIERTRDENHPTLPDADEGAIAIERGYSSYNPADILERFGPSRQRLIQTIAGLKPSDWDRTAIKEPIGHVTIADLIGLIVAHDVYHLRQILEYRRLFERSLATV